MSDAEELCPTSRPGPRRRLLTPNEVAEWLGVSAAWVRDHATRKKPKLPSVRLGKLMRFREDEVQEFINTWAK